jgi:hypothetical protein
MGPDPSHRRGRRATLPRECAAYWVGEVGQPVSQDHAKPLVNEATAHMATDLARNLAYYAQLLKRCPLVPQAVHTAA